MTAIRVVASPGDSYIREMRAALAEASSFVLVTAFATPAGVELIAEELRALFNHGGQGRIILAVDRQQFNAAPVFEALLALKSSVGPRLAIGVVAEGAGLLHAKALFTQGPRGDQLLIGSANMTQSALGRNHELGLLVSGMPSDVRSAFLSFVDSIAPRSLDGADAQEFLRSRGLLPRLPAAPRAMSSEASVPIADILSAMPAMPPLDVQPEEHLAAWIGRGYLVGRGRRSLDALVLRFPQERAIRLGYLRAPQHEVLGEGSHETRTLGYGIDLVPTQESEVLRREARRVSLLLARVTLNLPCFGLWMPESYWEPYHEARQVMQAAGCLAPGWVLDAAGRQRQYLVTGGLEAEVDRVIGRLKALNLLVEGKEAALKELVLPRFRDDLQRRTPSVLASCIEFRTARQRWSPFEHTEQPFRQLMTDVVQATFSSTYRTGRWPQTFRSHASRRVADAIAGRLQAAGQEPDGDAALAILHEASSWESEGRPIAEVCEGFRRLVDDDLEFPPPEVEVLTKTTSGLQDDVEGEGDQ